MERCENISIASVNSVCTEPAYSVDDCNVSYVNIYLRLYNSDVIFLTSFFVGGRSRW